MFVFGHYPLTLLDNMSIYEHGKRRESTTFDMAGVRIRQIREALELTQYDVSVRANISRTKLIRIENNEISPRLDELSAIASALGYEVQDLITNEISEYERSFVIAFRRLIFAYFRHFSTINSKEKDNL